MSGHVYHPRQHSHPTKPPWAQQRLRASSSHAPALTAMAGADEAIRTTDGGALTADATHKVLPCHTLVRPRSARCSGGGNPSARAETVKGLRAGAGPCPGSVPTLT